MISQQTLKGNLVLQDYTTAFTLNQGDKGVPFRIELLENGTPYTLLSDDIVTIEWLKPNGNPFLQEGDIKYGTTYIEFTTPESVAQYSGSGTFNIIISNSDVRKGTIRREYKVVPTSMKPGSVSEDTITDAITELRELSVEIADTVQNNQELINNNTAATKSDIATVNSSLEDNMNLLNQIGFNFIQQGGENDGITNNTPILQSLINTLSIMGGGNIYIPDGEYFFGRTTGKDYAVEVVSNVNIYGAGIGKTILKIGYGDSKDGEGYSLFHFIKNVGSETPTFVENCTYRDFTVDGYNMTMTQYSHKGKAFYMQNVRNAIFENLELKGLPSTALGIDFLHNVHISKIHCYECGRLWEEQWVYDGVTKGRGPGGAGIGIGTGNLVDENFTISDCITDKCGHFGIFLEHQGIFNTTWHNKDAKGVTISNCITKHGRFGGLGLRGGTNITISNCESYGNKLGIRIDINGSEDETLNSIVKIEKCKVVNCTFTENTRDGIMLTGDINVDTLMIDNNIIANNGEYGISIGLNGKTSLKNINTNINSNKIYNNGSHGILIEKGISFENLEIGDNDVINNGGYGIVDKGIVKVGAIESNKIINNNVCGIKIYGEKIHYAIKDNYSVRDTNTTKTQEYGLYVESAPLNYSTIIGNDFRRNSVQSMYIDKTSVKNTTLIQNNLVEENEYRLETPSSSYAQFPSSILKNNGNLTIRLKFKFNSFDTSGSAINGLISLVDEYSNGTYARGFTFYANTSGITLVTSNSNSNSAYEQITFSTTLNTDTEYNMLLTISSSTIRMSINDTEISKTINNGTEASICSTILESYKYNDRLLLSDCIYKTYHKGLGDIDFTIFNIVGTNTHQYLFNNIGVNNIIKDTAYGTDGKCMNKAKQNYLIN